MGFNDSGWADGNIKRNLGKKVSQTIDKAQSDIIHGIHPAHIEYGSVDSLAEGNSPSLVGTGASIFLDQNHANSITPDTRNIVSMSPEATILIKKKVFSSLKSSNDLRFMDKTEKMLLRATKALFAYKVQQIRAYEALTKFENFFSETGKYSLSLLSSVLRETSRLDLSKLGYTESEYVEKELNKWYYEVISVYRTSPQSSWVIGPENNVVDRTVTPYVFDEAVGMALPGDIGFDVSIEAVDAVGFTGDGIQRQKITNLEFLKTLPPSSAKDLIKKKKDSSVIIKLKK